jgi:hypothetical protein
MRITAEPRSDQWNADDFIGGPRTFTIAAVATGKAEQKYDIELVEGEGRAWRPPLTMLRLLIAAWGDEADQWAGRRVRLYRDESVRFGSDAVGGIRISHMSHLPGNKSFSAMLTSTRGRRTRISVDPLPDEPSPRTASKTPTAAGIIGAFKAFGVTLEQLEARAGTEHTQWTADDITALATLGKAIKNGETTVYEEFEPEQPTLDEPTAQETDDQPDRR